MAEYSLSFLMLLPYFGAFHLFFGTISMSTPILADIVICLFLIM